MNRTITILAVVIAAFLGFSAAWWLLESESGAPGSPDTESGREILYWVAPMDSNYRRDQPGKSPMGMDLVPVYADEQEKAADAEPSMRIEPAVVNNIGVKTAAVERGTLHRRIETVGFIVPDDERLAHIHMRTEGWIEQLEIDTAGDLVRQGDLLFRIYSPALVSAQEEYLQALHMDRSSIIKASGARLRALGMQADQIKALRSNREVQQLFDVYAPRAGHVMELNVRHGMFVEPGTMIMSLADLSAIWVDVDVFENQIGWVEPGQAARMWLPFAPDRVWSGNIEYVYPTIRTQSRTARLRLAFDNPDIALKPGMYATVEIDAAPREDVLHIPAQAVIRTGRQERVILVLGEGRFRPAEVRTGLESAGRVEIVDGLAEGEQIVVSSHFLIDSEASTDASLLRMRNDSDMGGRDMGKRDPQDHGVTDEKMDDHGMSGYDDMSGRDTSGMEPEDGDPDRGDHTRRGTGDGS